MVLPFNVSGIKTIVNGSTVYDCAFPGITRTNSGRLIVVYGQSSGHGTLDSDVRCLHSDNGGVSWSGIRVVVNPSEPNVSAGGPGIHTSPINGRVHVVYWYLRSDNSKDTYSKFSDDYGITWSTGVHVADDRMVVSPPVTVNGYLILPVFSGGIIQIYKSTNHGASWSYLSTLPQSGYYLSEPYAFLRTDGQVFILARNMDNHISQRCASADGGATWTGWAPVWECESPIAVHRMMITNRYVCVYRAPNDHKQHNTRASNDGFVSWSSPKKILQAPDGGLATYGGIASISSTRAVCVMGCENADDKGNIRMAYLDDPN